MKRVIFYGLALPVIIVLVGLLLPFARPSRGPHPPENRIHTDAVSIEMAVQQYEIAVGERPHGDNPEVFRALLGTNALGLALLSPGRINTSGEMLDPWGSPYRIEDLGHTNFAVRSGGRNRSYGDSDDYVFDSAKRDFVQLPKR